MAPISVTEAEARILGEWQGRVTQALEHLKSSVEKLERDGSTRRDFEALNLRVDKLQDTLEDIPAKIQAAVTSAYAQAESAFNQRIADLGVLEIRGKTDGAAKEIATLKEATNTLKNTALRYGLIGGGIPTSIMVIAALLYFLLTGKPLPA